MSIGAVSFALNGRKGVSDETRARILRVADELGWAPSTAARSLAEAKTETFGLVLARDPARVDAACRQHLKSARHTLLTSVPEVAGGERPGAQ